MRNSKAIKLIAVLGVSLAFLSACDNKSPEEASVDDVTAQNERVVADNEAVQGNDAQMAEVQGVGVAVEPTANKSAVTTDSVSETEAQEVVVEETIQEHDTVWDDGYRNEGRGQTSDTF